MAYYIKNIWGPDGQNGYPEVSQTEFAEGQEKAAERFSQCDGFLLYETGHCENNKIGAKSIFAKGSVISPEVLSNKNIKKYGKGIGVAERSFPYAIKIKLDIRINPLNGIPLNAIRRIIEKPKETMQRLGGLIRITEDQFDVLSLELDRAKNNDK